MHSLRMYSNSGALILVGVILTQVALSQAVVRICLPTNIDAATGTAASALLNAASGSAVEFAVFGGGNADACISQVVNGNADLTKFGGDGLYGAYLRQLHVYVAETVSLDQQPSDASAGYYSVAVTTKQVCDALGDRASLAAFKGRSACHTGYRRAAGWTLPVGYMINNNIMTVLDRVNGVEQDAETVANHWSNVCAAGTTSAGPAAGGTKWDPLCSGCKGDCSSNILTEPYVDYEGSLRCLNEGAGEISFTKHTTLFTHSRDGTTPPTWARLAKADLRLVCPSGGCRPIEQWQDCNIAKSATHSFVGRPNFASTTEGAAAVRFLSSGINSTLISRSRSLLSSNPNLMFTASAAGMRALPNPSDFAAHMGTVALEAFRTVRDLEVPLVRICTASSAEQTTCSNSLNLMNSKAVGVRFSCVQKENDEQCLRAIRGGEADMKAFDGPDIYNGLRDFNLKAIAAEDYGTGDGIIGTEYFAVALVRKQFCDANGGNPTFVDLKGKRSCSTGYRRSAGWSMPTGFLIQSGIMPIVRNDPNVEDDAESMAAFFSGGICAARAVDNGPVNTADKKGARWDPLCKQCKGDCSSNINNEPYYDYAGAARCIHDGVADVAWTKHTVALDFAQDGKTPASWSSLPQGELRLLCPSGGCAPLSQAFRCHVAKAAAHAVMVRAEYPDSDRLKSALVALGNDPAFQALLFNGTSNPNNHVFKSSTRQIVRVDDDTRSYLGATLGVFQGLDALNSGGNPGVAQVRGSTSGGDSKGLSTGAAVGIAIGCAAAGAILAVALVLFVNKRRNRKGWTEGLAGSGNSSSPADKHVVLKPGPM